MTIDGNFYRNDIKLALRGGAMKVAQIKARLAARNVNLDETQILTALEGMIKARQVVRTDGKFGLVTIS